MTGPALVSKQPLRRHSRVRGDSAMDILLLSFIEATDEAQADRSLTLLIDDHAGPIVREILGASLRLHIDIGGTGSSSQDAGDLFNDIVVNLVSRLRQLKNDPARYHIADFRSYVAGAAYNACNLYLRHRFPRRCRLKNRLRYLLSHDEAFALWPNNDSALLCGFALWSGKGTHAPGRFLEKIRQDPAEWLEAVGLKSAGISRAALSSLLRALFHWSGSPFKLDDLVSVVAEICGEKDQPDEPLETVVNLAAPALSFETVLQRQRTLSLLWQEVCQLPRRQRVALLLNFRDARGQELISLLPFARIATIEQIADAIDVSHIEFLRLWNELPLDDLAIARLLGATRQQVINLRKCARERLERRMSTHV